MKSLISLQKKGGVIHLGVSESQIVTDENDFHRWGQTGGKVSLLGVAFHPFNLPSFTPCSSTFGGSRSPHDIGKPIRANPSNPCESVIQTT